MKKITLLLLLCAIPLYSFSQDVIELSDDIHIAGDGTEASDPLFQTIKARAGLTIIGDKMVFSGRDETAGRELWISDGTSEGTKLLKDINANGDSNPQEFSASGNKLYFNADDGVHGSELWVTDGTAEGTKLVKDINAGGAVDHGNPRAITHIGDKIIFFASVDEDTPGVFVSDGTAEGTELLHSLIPEIIDDTQMPGFVVTRVGNQVYFKGNDVLSGVGTELWATDGTSEGTRLVEDIYPGANSSTIMWLVNFHDKYLIFRANDSINGGELYKALPDDSVELIKEINSQQGDDKANGCGCAFFEPLGDDKFMFRAKDDGTFHNEPYITDGTAEGTIMLVDVEPAPGKPSFGNPMELNGRVLIRGKIIETHVELFIVDMDGSNLELVKDINPGAGWSKSLYFTRVGDDKMYFSANTDTEGYELWVTDGTTDGTTMVTNLMNTAEENGAHPFSLVEFDGDLYFSALSTGILYKLPLSAPFVRNSLDHIIFNDVEVTLNESLNSEDALSFDIAAGNLTGDITITPPSGFQLSLTSDAGYQTTPLVITPTDGAVNTKVYVVPDLTELGTISGRIKIESPGIYPQKIGVTASGIESTVSISQKEVLDRMLNVYPNPSNGIINISYTGNEAFTTRLIDLAGKVVQASKQTSIENTILDVSNLSKGIYILQVHTTNAVISRRIIIQ